jgi:predicted RNA-binding Zn-ribbon protein involved in translation (DUF1610 family)
MDVTTITAASQSLKSVKDLLAAVFEAKVDAEAKPKILEAQARLGEVQDTLFVLREHLFHLQEERNQLKSELAASEAWLAKLNQYELSLASGGGIVYRYKGEPTHFACPSCINTQQIHILQDNRTISGKYRCTGCNSEFPIEPRRKVEPLPTQHRWPSEG